jgi:hypothetical protein
MHSPLFGIIFGIAVLGFVWKGITNSHVSWARRIPLVVLAGLAGVAIVFGVVEWMGGAPLL